MGFFDEDKELPDKGFYKATLEDVSIDETKDVPRVSVRYELSTGDKVWQNFIFKDTTRRFVSWQMSQLGAWADAKSICKNPDNLSDVARSCMEAISKKIGYIYELDLSHREYNGRVSADVKVLSLISEAQAEETPRVINKTKEPTFDENEELPF
jgi:hypothetical protein